MDFTLYSEKSAADCIKALSDRLLQSETPTRPALNGSVNKNGKFRLTLRQKVLAGITHETWIEGEISKEQNITLIRGRVPDGAPPDRQRLVAIAIPVSGVIMLLREQAVMAVVVMGLLMLWFIMLRGDYMGSDRLLLELEKNLKASPKPPKSLTQQNGGSAAKATAPRKA